MKRTGPGTREKLKTQFMEPVGSAPDEFRAVVERWAPVIWDNGFRVE